MSNKRRIIIILLSVTTGSFLAMLLVKSRMGTLSDDAWKQMAFNFAFAMAIVLVIGILLRNKGDKM